MQKGTTPDSFTAFDVFYGRILVRVTPTLPCSALIVAGLCEPGPPQPASVCKNDLTEAVYRRVYAAEHEHPKDNGCTFTLKKAGGGLLFPPDDTAKVA